MSLFRALISSLGEVQPQDQYWQNVLVYMPMTSDLLDTKNNTIQSFGGLSAASGFTVFDGTDDYLSMSPSPLTGFGRSDFTVEGFYERDPIQTGAQNRSLVWMGNNTLAASTTADGFSHNDTSTTIFSSTIFSTSSFTHFAAVKDGLTIRLYLDGVQVKEQTYPNESAVPTQKAEFGLHIGATYIPSQFIAGKMRHVRVTRGVCRYPNGTSFTPPSAPYPTSGGVPPPTNGPGAHRYWRINILEPDGSTLYMGMTDIGLLDKDGVDVTSTLGVSSSSFINASNVGVNAFDRNFSTGWLSSSASSPEWIAIDLFSGYGQPSEIKTVKIWGSWNQPTASPKNFEVQWSDDGTSWTTAASFTNSTGWGAAELREFSIY